jgi:hypothetical protein
MYASDNCSIVAAVTIGDTHTVAVETKMSSRGFIKTGSRIHRHKVVTA